MKIYTLKVAPELQPSSQAIEYPSGNIDYGVEQDFLDYLSQNDGLLVDSPEAADWHYLPVFWTRWHLNHDYGAKGRRKLQSLVNSALINPKKTFTVCQYDDGPIVNLRGAVQFLASRKGKVGIDIPLLRNAHTLPLLPKRKKYRASFIGRLRTHPVRNKMAKALEKTPNVFFHDGDAGQKFFVDKTLESYIALSPRGYGGSSFRFFEAMQLGAVPLLISDIDTRPFKRYIDWDKMSLLAKDTRKLSDSINRYSDKELKAMGKIARKTYLNVLQYGQWPKYALKELENL